jgi:hypothetical protein
MLVATVGYAAGEGGVGLAYARLMGSGAARVVRRVFRTADPGDDRAVAYGAITAVADALAKRRLRGVRFVIGNAAVAAEIANRSGVPDPLMLAHVRLRCALNALDASVTLGTADELTQRARAEIALNLAA